MIILDKPYVSPFMEETLIRLQIPVLDNGIRETLKLSPEINWVRKEAFLEHFNHDFTNFYCVSENAFSWIYENLQNSVYPEKIALFKDKFRFRQAMSQFSPQFQFQKVMWDQLDTLEVENIKKPFIIKPVLGFFSTAVYRVDTNDQWPLILANLKEVMENNRGVFPPEVLNDQEFIIEDLIEGEEFAVDAYFNENSEPVILNILQHMFGSDHDTGDRVYYTSKKIILRTHELIQSKLQQVGEVTGVKRFPVHAEFRIDSANNIEIIEANPMRFAGLCVTDIAYFAYGTNNYELFFSNTTPNWKDILAQKADDEIYAMIVGDLPKEIKLSKIIDVDYDAFLGLFTHPLELRKMAFKEFPLFAILFVKVKESNIQELRDVLQADYSKYLIME